MLKTVAKEVYMNYNNRHIFIFTNNILMIKKAKIKIITFLKKHEEKWIFFKLTYFEAIFYNNKI